MESLNAELIKQGLPQKDRLRKLNTIAIEQMKILVEDVSMKRLKGKQQATSRGTSPASTNAMLPFTAEKQCSREPAGDSRSFLEIRPPFFSGRPTPDISTQMRITFQRRIS